MTGYGSWVCQRCGATVPGGCTHYCPTTAWPPQPPATPPARMDHGFAYVAALQRIAAALEKIAEHLKARAAA